jgi:hypothetical protein
MTWVPIFLGAFKGIILLIGMIYAIKWHHDQDKKAKDAGESFYSPTEMRFFVTMIAVMGMAVAGIAYAACWGDPADGGWGGALGCALAFIISFTGKPAAPSPLVEAKPEPINLGDALIEVAHLKAEMEAQAACMDAAWREKIYLGVAGIIGALSWKFGAVAAGWLNFTS